MLRASYRQILLLLGLALLPALGQVAYFGDRVSWRAPALQKDEVELADALTYGEALMWVDARPSEQYEQEHIPGALLLNEDSWNELLPQFLSTWSPGKRVVVYCSSRSCAASHEVARRLREEAKLPEVYVLHGGWEKWKASQP